MRVAQALAQALAQTCTGACTGLVEVNGQLLDFVGVFFPIDFDPVPQTVQRRVIGQVVTNLVIMFGSFHL